MLKILTAVVEQDTCSYDFNITKKASVLIVVGFWSLTMLFGVAARSY